MFSDEGTLTPDPHNTDESPEHMNLRGGHMNKGMPVEKMKTLRLHRKDFKKGGEALRGKNVTEGYRLVSWREAILRGRCDPRQQLCC